MSLITTIIDGIAPNPSSGLGGANEGHIQGFQDDIITGVAGGVADKAGGQCLVTENSPLGMSVLVADGVVYVPNADYIANLATATKYYRVVIKAEDPIAIPSNTSGDTCQHGLDVVVDKVTVPNEYGSNIATLVVTLGTSGAGAPAVPDNGYRLAEVEVVNGATQIANASIIDSRAQITIDTDVLPSTTVYTTATQTLTNKTLTSPVLTTPKITTSINDANGNEVIKTPATASAVNEVTVTNSATGNAVKIEATGGDTDISLNLVSKGAGTVQANGVAITSAPVDGWTAATGTWTYASASTITVPSGAAAKYAKGDKIKLTQTTEKYFYVIGVADTVLTVTGGSDYTVANAPITNNYYSHESSPIGFPSVFNWTPTLTDGSADLSGFDTAIFSIEGKRLKLYFLAANKTVSGSAGHIRVTVPVSISQGVAYALGTYRYYLSGAYVYARCEPATTYLALHKGMTSEQWAGNETGVYIVVEAEYWI